MCEHTHARAGRGSVQVCRHPVQTHRRVLHRKQLCSKNSWSTEIRLGLDTSAGLLWTSGTQIAFCSHASSSSNWPQLCVIRHENKAKAPALMSTEPLKALGCILTMQDPEQLQDLSSRLTNSPLHYGLLADTLPQPPPLNHRC